MPSAVIRRFDYDPASRTLTVDFTTGRRYAYFNVPENEVANMRGVIAKGRYFNAHIRTRYRFEELESD